MNINKKFADIVHNSLWEVDELGDDILLEENLKEPTIFTDQLPPMVFPFGYMIISSTFAYYDEDEDGNEE